MSVWTACVKAYVRGNGGFYPIAPDEYPALVAAWKGGQTFFSGTTIDGDEVTIKLAEVEAIMFSTVSSQEAADARSKREAKAAERESFE